MARRNTGSYLRAGATKFRKLSLSSKKKDPEPEEVDIVVRYRPESLDALCRMTKFTKKEIQLMYRGFKQGCTTGIVSLEQFQEIYAQFFPQDQRSNDPTDPPLDSGRYSTFVFNTFDTDHNGSISFEEFVVGISVLSKGTIEEKINWIFQLYDINQNGFINRNDMKIIIRAIYDLMGHNTEPQYDEEVIDDHVDDIFNAMDANKDGIVTQLEFLDSCRANKQVSDALGLFDTVL